MDDHVHLADAARVLMANAPEDWVALRYSASLHDDAAVDITYDAIADSGTERWFLPRNADDSSSIVDSFLAVRDEIGRRGGQKPAKVRFTVHRDGTFKTEFEYD